MNHFELSRFHRLRDAPAAIYLRVLTRFIYSLKDSNERTLNELKRINDGNVPVGRLVER